MSEKKSTKKKQEENVIFVGNKKPMSYAMAIATQFNNGSNEVVVKARGRAISRAVDAAEITKNKFIPTVKVKKIVTGTENVTNNEGKKSNISSIEILLTLKK